jgi:hypothetical protein
LGPDGTGGNGGDGVLGNTSHEVHGLGGSWVGGGDMGFTVSGSKSNFVDVHLVLAGEDLTVRVRGWAFLSWSFLGSFLISSSRSAWVLDADDGKVEWSGNILSDLRLGVENDSGFFFEGDLS